MGGSHAPNHATQVLDHAVFLVRQTDCQLRSGTALYRTSQPHRRIATQEAVSGHSDLGVNAMQTAIMALLLVLAHDRALAYHRLLSVSATYSACKQLPPAPSNATLGHVKNIIGSLDRLESVLSDVGAAHTGVRCSVAD